MGNGSRAALPVSALLLAGGAGERMGGNKLFLSHEGAWLLENLLRRLHVFADETLLCCGRGEEREVGALFAPLLRAFGVRVVEDGTADRGPLEGLGRGLGAMRNRWGFLLGCDMPTPQEAVVRRLWDLTPPSSQACVVRMDGYLMPLHAFYRADCAPFVAEALKKTDPRKGRAEAKLKSFYGEINLNVVEEQALAFLPGYRKSFAGFNTPEELRDALRA